MNRLFVGGLLLILATSSGCRMCANSCDYLPPVLDGPYSAHATRAGSGSNAYLGPPTVEDVVTPAPLELPQAEDSESSPVAQELTE